MGTWNEGNQTGFGLEVGPDGALAFRIGAGQGRVTIVSSGVPLSTRRWHLAAAAFDAVRGIVTLWQEPLTAHDFVYTWEHVRGLSPSTAFLFSDMAEANALDDHTLEVVLREPRNYFPYVLASHWAYPWPRHRVEEAGAAWRWPESLVGNGPFVLAGLDDRHAVLRANPRWNGPRGNVETVTIEFATLDEASLA